MAFFCCYLLYSHYFQIAMSFLFDSIIFLYFCCICVHVCRYQQSSKETSDSLELKSQMIVSCWCRSWELNQGPEGEQQGLLVTEWSLQPLLLFFS